MKNRLLLLLSLGMFSLLQAQKIRLNTAASKLTYHAKHIAHNWEGVNKKLQGLAVIEEGQPKQLAIKASVRDFDSKNANRDSHALEVLEALRFPEVRYYSKSIEKTSEGDITIVGVLSFHGVEASKTVIAEYSSSNTGFRIQGSFNFNATDFGVSLPSFLLVKINEIIAIDYDLLFESIP